MCGQMPLFGPILSIATNWTAEFGWDTIFLEQTAGALPFLLEEGKTNMNTVHDGFILLLLRVGKSQKTPLKKQKREKNLIRLGRDSRHKGAEGPFPLLDVVPSNRSHLNVGKVFSGKDSSIPFLPAFQRT